MKKKIGIALATLLTLAILQWAAASVETKPAAAPQTIQEQTHKSCAKCPVADPEKCPISGAQKSSTSDQKCPYSGTKS